MGRFFMRRRQMLAPRRVKKVKAYNRKKRFIRILALIFTVLVILFFVLSTYDAISQLVVNELQYRANRLINEAVCEVFADPDINCFDVKNYGTYNVVSINAYRANNIKSYLSDMIYEKFDSSEYNKFEIHLGTVLFPYMFAGRGPYLNVRIVPVTDILVNFRNENETYGINQVVNNLYVNVEIDVCALGTAVYYKTTVESDIIAAQTVISGNVPNTYVNVKGESKIDKK